MYIYDNFLSGVVPSQLTRFDYTFVGSFKKNCFTSGFNADAYSAQPKGCALLQRYGISRTRERYHTHLNRTAVHACTAPILHHS